MKRIFGFFVGLAMLSVFSGSLQAGAEVDISISLPPLIEFSAPPELVVIPDTNVYVAPDVNADIFFYEGWWWRPWHGRWYRSQDYRSGWGYYRNAPVFYRNVPSGWRADYRAHRWQGHPWNYQRMPHQQVQSNWHHWEKDRYWERQNGWGVQGMHSHGQYREAQPAQGFQPNRNVHQPLLFTNHRLSILSKARIYDHYGG